MCRSKKLNRSDGIKTTDSHFSRLSSYIHRYKKCTGECGPSNEEKTFKSTRQLWVTLSNLTLFEKLISLNEIGCILISFHRLGNGDDMATNFDSWRERDPFNDWTRNERLAFNDWAHSGSLAERLRSDLSNGFSQLTSGSTFNRPSCTTQCSNTVFAGFNQDQIVEQIRSKITADLQNGKISTIQMYQPNWFEQQVTQKLLDLKTHHQQQYEQYAEMARKKFQENVDKQTVDQQPNGNMVVPQMPFSHMTIDEYNERLYRLREDFASLGATQLSHNIYNAIIASGGFSLNGIKYRYNASSGHYEKTTEGSFEVSNELSTTLQQLLRQIAAAEMSEQEFNQTISTGVFIRNGYRYTYNSERKQFESSRITEEERQNIFSRIEELTQHLGYRSLTQQERDNILTTGYFIRGGHKWVYNIVDGTMAKTVYVGELAELRADEYRELYRKVQETLRRMGYAEMSTSQCNATIASGIFKIGGITWNFNSNSQTFEPVELSQNEYQNRVSILRNELIRLGHQELSPLQTRDIIYQGYFNHDGYRYEYVNERRRYERVQGTSAAEEYRERVRKLRQQLMNIGYGPMNDADCNATITSGKFQYNGHEWVYSFQTKDYQKGRRTYCSEMENGSAEISNPDRGDQPPVDGHGENILLTTTAAPVSRVPCIYYYQPPPGSQPPSSNQLWPCPHSAVGGVAVNTIYKTLTSS